MSPEDAVRTHADVRGRVMIPVHWATFNLGFHAWNDPVERALAAAAAMHITLYVPRPGELVEPRAIPVQTRWWR